MPATYHQLPEAKDCAAVCAELRAEVDALLPGDPYQQGSMDRRTYDTIALASLRLSQAATLLHAVAGDPTARDIARMHVDQYHAGQFK